MKTTMPRTSTDSSSSSSSTIINLQLLKIAPKEGGGERRDEDEEDAKPPPGVNVNAPNSASSSAASEQEAAPATSASRKRTPSATEAAVSRLRSVLMAALPGRRNRPPGLGSRVTGTLFGHRRGHVQLAFQGDARSPPVVLIELATPTAALVREMSSGLVRIALECERKADGREKPAAARLVEEPLWRAYCNGKKCGYAMRRECGPAVWKVLRAVEPVSMGAGVIPGDGSSEGDIMYMRARFERVVGSKDSEAFYMMNPDGNGGPELSVYFLRVQ